MALVIGREAEPKFNAQMHLDNLGVFNAVFMDTNT